MEVYTTTFAAVFTILVFVVRPSTAIALLVVSCLIWPEYLRFSVGIAEMSVPRVMALAILFRQVFKGRLRATKFSLIDWLIIFIWLWGIFAASIATGGVTPARMIGTGLDTMVIYFAVRLSFRNLQELKGLVTPLILIAVLMCGVGLAEAVLKFTPYRQLMVYGSWDFWQGMSSRELRLGFLRAQGTTTQAIIFGMAMMMVASLIWALRDFVKSKKMALFAFSTAVLAALTSLSSGPWVGCALLFFFNSYYKKPSLIKPSLWGLLALMVFAELFSSRHFYHLIGYLGISSSGTAYYRTRLLEVMINHLDEYWFVGNEGRSTDQWVSEIGGQASLDIVNHYLLLAFSNGLLAALLYIAVHVLVIKRAVAAYQGSQVLFEKKVMFGLIAAIITIDVTSMSVGLFGPALIMSNIILGLTVAVSDLLVRKPTQAIVSKNVNFST